MGNFISTQLWLFHSRLIISGMQYCFTLWDTCDSIHAAPLKWSLVIYGTYTNFQKLQRVQNAAVRIVCQSPRRHHHSVGLLKDLHWLPVRGRVDYTGLPSSVLKPLNYNNLRILYVLVYSRHIDSRVCWGHLRLTYCQHSLHRQTLLLVGSPAALPSFGTVFPHLNTHRWQFH